MYVARLISRSLHGSGIRSLFKSHARSNSVDFGLGTPSDTETRPRSDVDQPVIDSVVVTHFVKELYLTALWRGADDEGLRHHVDLLAAAEDPLYCAATMLSNFRHSSEGRRLRALLAPENDSNAVHNWTLGTNCYAAASLRGAGLRHTSYPLDWVFSNAKMALDCIQDGFSKFLNPIYYEQTNASGIDHAYYRDFCGVPTVFAHRDPRQPENYVYFKRGVDRFHDRMAASDRSKVTMISSQPDRDSPYFKRLAEYFDQKASNVSFTMLCVESPNRDGIRAAGFQTQQSLGSHCLVEYRPSGEKLEMGFLNPIDDLMIRAFLSNN
jgi:hypothetical protein